MVPECCVCHASFDVVCNVSEYGMWYVRVCVSSSINVCMFTVSNALLMSNATAIVCVGGMSWLKPVATVLLMLCSALFVECLVLNPCCVVMFGMFCVIYHLFKCFAITDRRDIGMYDVPMLMSLLGLGTGMMLANFHTCGILLSLSAALYIIIIIYNICIAPYNTIL